MPKRYFGTDGIRGRVGCDPITPDFFVHLGGAIGQVLTERWGSAHVIIGKDTRISGYLIESALESGLSSAGVDVSLAGPLPTSGIAYLAQTLRLQMGIVVSASHNRYHDNGVKFFDQFGDKLSDEAELAIEEKIARRESMTFRRHPGRAFRLDDAAGRYIEFCKRTFAMPQTLRGLRVLIDCANGAAYRVAQNVFYELGAGVDIIAAEPDGFNINDGCGVSDTTELQRQMRAGDYDIGFALDGDADRMLFVDRDGRLYDGDAALYVVAHYLHHNGFPVEGIVGTQMSNMALAEAAGEWGAGFARSPVGDRHVARCLKENRWKIGGEPSGHLLFFDHHNTGDGIVSALQILKVMVQTEQDIAQLLAPYQPYPQRRIDIAVADKQAVCRDARLLEAIADHEARLAGRGRILVRYSGTEEIVRVMVEAREEERCVAVADELAQLVRHCAEGSETTE